MQQVFVEIVAFATFFFALACKFSGYLLLFATLSEVRRIFSLKQNKISTETQSSRVDIKILNKN